MKFWFLFCTCTFRTFSGIWKLNLNGSDCFGWRFNRTGRSFRVTSRIVGAVVEGLVEVEL